ncbi:uncharacterized protein DNG_05679 [Cephalotrichum gorgonifer]|uniref:Pkinase domain-containing protein n=1 Tax=Cephalotrichum gorgonifer TaxID=2041049 RepID=A0AAE8SVR7_9PEZI|nr:uncharacterized protein DNG_05679 [Cephalotrichum gorgonifer]
MAHQRDMFNPDGDVIGTIIICVTDGSYYSGPNEVPLYRFKSVTIGRGERNDISLDTDDVSRHQCEIFAVTFDREVSRAPTIYVRDRQSTNRTFVFRRDDQFDITGENGVEPSAWLLEPGVQISFGRYLVEVIQRYKQIMREGFLRFQVQEIEQFKDEFEITDIILGTGGQGQVRLAYHVQTGKQVCVKMVNLVETIGKLGSEGGRWASRVKQEADYLSKLDHELQWVMRQVVGGLKYIHARGLVHRDLKPENILFAVAPKAGYRICISDFGCAAIHGRRRLTSFVGTENYQAPEIIRGDSDQDPSVDMWALGILALHLACRNQGMDVSVVQAFSHRTMPNQAEIDSLLRNMARDGNAFSRATFDFVSACLQVDPRRRIKAEEATRHPILTHNDGVFRALEELRNRGSPGVSPLVEMGRELRDVAPGWRIGMKSIPPPRSDSAAQRLYGIAHAGRSSRPSENPYTRGPPAAATLRATVCPHGLVHVHSHPQAQEQPEPQPQSKLQKKKKKAKAQTYRDPASPYTPRTPAEPQNPFRMSPHTAAEAVTLRRAAPQVSPTRNPRQAYISPQLSDRTIPIHNPRPQRPPVWSIFNKAAEGAYSAARTRDGEEEKPQGGGPSAGYAASFGMEEKVGRPVAPTDPGPWDRDVKGRNTPYPRFSRE